MSPAGGMQRLGVQATGQIPLREVSGLGQRRDTRAGSLQVLAVGDEAFTVAVGTMADASGVPEFDTVSVEEVLAEAAGRAGSEWEAADGDSSGRVFILQESPSKVFVLGPGLDELVHVIDLELAPNERAEVGWDAAPNARAEGLVLLRNGHVLVAKEKDPPLLMEFGPPREPAAGARRDLLFSGGAAFPVPRGRRSRFSLQTVWRLGGVAAREIGDISDLAVGPDQLLYLLSDESRCIARLQAELAAPSEHLEATARWALPDALEQPEGLVVLDGMIPIVAVDRPDPGEALFVLEPLEG
jgi:hypothetical protein